MNLLVTGASGYIGSHTLCELSIAGHSIYSIDNFANSSAKALKDVQKIAKIAIKNFEVDLCDWHAVTQLLNEIQPRAVIHFAGCKAVDESFAYPLKYYENNVHGTLGLLKAMEAVNCHNIIFSSSATVYGEPEILPLTEAHPLAPVNPYGRTKLYIEEMIKDWCSANVLRSAVLLRYFNPVGAHPTGLIGESPTGVPSNVMPYISQVAAGEREVLSVFGNDYDTIDGTGVRDYIHVCDLAEGHVAALDYCLNNQHVDTFNLGTGQGFSVLELVHAFENVTGQNVPYTFVPRRAGDVATCFADVTKAKTYLNWEAKRSLRSICADQWAWQQNHCNRQGTLTH